MLTARGAGTLLCSLGLLIAARLLGADEALYTAVFLAGLVLTALVWCALHIPIAAAGRALAPSMLRAGGAATCTITLQNRRRGPLVHARLLDKVHDTHPVAFYLGKLDRGEAVTVAERLRCAGRGAFGLGPLVVEVADPFRLARVRRVLLAREEHLVFPAFEELHGVPFGRGARSQNLRARPDLLGSAGEEFYALREYSTGDDLRRVSWKASARMDRLMIQQLEITMEQRAIVFLDHRAKAHRGGNFEAAVQAATSVVECLAGAGAPFEFALAAPSGLETLSTPDAYRAALARLAVVQPVDEPESLYTSLAPLRTPRVHSVVLVTGELSGDEVRAVAAVATRERRVVVAWCGAADDTGPALLRRAGATVLTMDEEGHIGPAWSREVGRAWAVSAPGSA